MSCLWPSRPKNINLDTLLFCTDITARKPNLHGAKQEKNKTAFHAYLNFQWSRAASIAKVTKHYA